MKQAFLVAITLALTGCPDEEGTGSVTLAVTTTGSDGATYRLSRWAWISLESETYHESFSLEGDGATVRLEVPPGTYRATFGEEGSQWPLERHLGSGPVETVLATLITPMPITVNVVDGGAVSIVLGFRVPNQDTITFDGSGEVNVSIDVSEGTPTGYEIEAGAFMDYVVQRHDYLLPAHLAARFPEVGESQLPYLFEARISGEFVRVNSRTICAPIEVSRLTSSTDSGLSDAFAEAIAEGGTANVCLDHANVSITMQRRGAATTPTFADSGASEHFFRSQLFTYLDESVYENNTLNIASLLNQHRVLMQMRVEVYGGPEPEYLWSHQSDYQGTSGVMLFGATY